MAKTLYIDNVPVVKEKKFTFVTTDAVAGATSVGIQSTIGFNSLTTSSGQIICLGELGQEKTEIIRTSNATAPGGTSITLNSGLRFDHPQDTKVYVIDWNRFEVQHATTVTGSKTTLEAYPSYIQPDQFESIYRDIQKTAGFYFIRFNETIENTNSDWSDAVPFGGYADNTVLAIKQRALNSLGEKISDLVSNEFLDEALWEGRREYHQSPGKRPFRRKFNADIGNITTGMYRVDLPSDTERPFTAENVYGVRVGPNPNMGYYDKKDWDKDYEYISHSTLATAYAVGDQDLYLADVRDLSDSGSVQVEDDTIGYSAKGISGGTLRISSNGAASHVVSSDVWQGSAFGLPRNFTVFGNPGGSAYIYFSCPVATAYASMNIYADYYRTVVDKNSDADELDEPNYDIYVPYLSYRMKKRRQPDLVLEKDSDYLGWLMRKQRALDGEYLETQIRITPDIDHLI